MTDLMVFLLDIYCCTIFCNRTDEDEEDESADRDESDDDDDGGVVQGQKDRPTKMAGLWPLPKIIFSSVISK
jgi:hypothetical protein